MASRIPSFRPRWQPTRKQAARTYDNSAARKADKAFYKGAAWAALRAAKLALSPLCEDCEKRKVLTVATQVHHILERKDRPDLAHDLDNLESLCLPCHNGKRKG